jgi:hypothetical protein
MRRLALATLPVAALLLTSCSWTFSPEKSDLQMAAQAAKVAGEDDATQRTAPLDLMAAGTLARSRTKPKVVMPAPVAAKVSPTTTALSSTPMVQNKPATMEITTATVLAMAKPLASGPAAAPTMPIVTPALAGDIDTKVPVNGTAIHLASYREIGSAKRGWQILSKNYKELVPLKPLYVAVDLPGKGHILRLYGTNADKASLKTICTEMHAEGAYCATNIAF